MGRWQGSKVKLTKHQENIMLFMASRHKTSARCWTGAPAVSAACGSNYSQKKNSSWALPKLRTLVKKGLLICDAYSNPVGGNDTYLFSFNPNSKEAFRLLLKTN